MVDREPSMFDGTRYHGYRVHLRVTPASHETLEGVLYRPPEDYRSYLFELRQVRSLRYEPVRLHSAGDVARFCDPLRNASRECVLSLCLDVKNAVTGVYEVGRGGLTSTLVSPREVFKAALKRNAAAILLVHNHPSGDPEPSREDLEITRRIQQGGQLLDVPLLDHVILGEDRYASLAERGSLGDRLSSLGPS